MHSQQLHETQDMLIQISKCANRDKMCVHMEIYQFSFFGGVYRSTARLKVWYASCCECLCVSLKKIAICQLLWIFCNLLSKEKENSFGQQLNIHLGV